MNKEDIKVNLIYFWQQHKDQLGRILFYLTFPVWIVIIILLLLVTAIVGDDFETVEEDKKWCKEHHYTYPEWEVYPHFKVKKYKKELKRQEAFEQKEYIRRRLREKLEKSSST